MLPTAAMRRSRDLVEGQAMVRVHRLHGCEKGPDGSRCRPGRRDEERHHDLVPGRLVGRVACGRAMGWVTRLVTGRRAGRRQQLRHTCHHNA